MLPINNILAVNWFLKLHFLHPDLSLENGYEMTKNCHGFQRMKTTFLEVSSGLNTHFCICLNVSICREYQTSAIFLDVNTLYLENPSCMSQVNNYISSKQLYFYFWHTTFQSKYIG